MQHYFSQLLSILNEMSPYLVLGFLISGLLHVYVPRALYARFLSKNGIRSVIGASILGVPLPLCSCGVIPTAMSLKKEGASDGATISFLVSTPQTGVDSILATYSLLGLPFAIIRAISAFFVGILSGLMVDLFGNKKCKATPPTTSPTTSPTALNFSIDRAALAKPAAEDCGCGCGEAHPPHHPHAEQPHAAAAAACSCGCGDHDHDHGHGHAEPCCSASEPSRGLKAALHYGYIHMMRDFGKWLVIGLLIAAAITAFVPDSVFALFKEHYFLNILLILLVSAPMYVCATGSIPIALSLLIKGVSPGAAFVLLMAGPATNMASLIILQREIGLRKTAIYLLSIIVGAIGVALFIDFALPADWFAVTADMAVGHDHVHGEACTHDDCSHGPVWWQTIMSVLFIVLFINSYLQKYLHRSKANGASDCGCGCS